MLSVVILNTFLIYYYVTRVNKIMFDQKTRNELFFVCHSSVSLYLWNRIKNCKSSENVSRHGTHVIITSFMEFVVVAAGARVADLAVIFRIVLYF